MKTNTNNFRVGEFLAVVLAAAKNDPTWTAAAEKAVLDYHQESTWRLPEGEKTPIRNCEFDVVANTAFGGSEGIYTDISFVGYPFGSTRETAHVYTFKTLETSREAFLAMSELGALVSWHAMETIGKNLDRFD